jgi:hypothetical protein
MVWATVWLPKDLCQMFVLGKELTMRKYHIAIWFLVGVAVLGLGYENLQADPPGKAVSASVATTLRGGVSSCTGMKQISCPGYCDSSAWHCDPKCDKYSDVGDRKCGGETQCALYSSTPDVCCN